MDRNFGIGLLLGLVIATGVIVPTFYVLGSLNQSNPAPLIIGLSLMQQTQTAPTINIKVNGSAVPQEFNLTLQTFVDHSYLARYVLIQEKRWTGTAPLQNYTEFWVGIPLTHLIYDIANVTTYSTVSVNASGFDKAFLQTDIDNATYADDLMVAYKKDGNYLTNPEGPVRFIATLDFTDEVYDFQVNGFYCVRQVLFIQIDS